MDPKVSSKLLTHHRRGYGVDVEALRDQCPPPAGRQKRPQDGISRVQKVAAVEIGFRGAPGCFRGIWVYIGGRSTLVDLRGAHKGGARLPPGRALLPRGLLASFLTSTPSLLDHVCSKNSSPKGFIPFGFRLIFLFYETLK